MKNLKTGNQKGSVLIIALILLIVLAFAAGTSLMNSTTNLKVGKNYAASAEVFNLAELGIARAKALMKNTSDFDTLLNTATYPGNIVVPTVTESEGTFSVKITNNTTGLNPDTGGAANDTDKILVVTSTAYGKSGNKVEIETYIGMPTTISFPAAPTGTGGGAVGLCGTGPNVDLSKGMVSGYDYNVPASFTCSGAGCDGTKVVPNSGTYGLVLDSAANASDRITTSDESHLEGYCATPPCKWTVNSSLDCTAWQNLSNQLAALPAGPSVSIITNCGSIAAGALGTRANPKVAIINIPNPNPNTCTIGSSTDGAGVLVVTSQTTSMYLGANMHYEGVIILLGDAATLTVHSTADLFGQLIVNSKVVDLAAEVTTSNPGSEIKYSTAAIATAMNAMMGGGGGGGGGQLVTYSWAERY